jgi:hypothetical protein
MLFSMEEQLLPKSENAPPWLIIFLETARKKRMHREWIFGDHRNPPPPGRSSLFLNVGAKIRPFGVSLSGVCEWCEMGSEALFT